VLVVPPVRRAYGVRVANPVPPRATEVLPVQPSVRLLLAIEPVTLVSLETLVTTEVLRETWAPLPTTAPVPPETERLLPAVKLPKVNVACLLLKVFQSVEER